MAWWHKLRQLLQPAGAAVDFLQWKAIMTEAQRRIDNGELQGVADLLRRHRRSDTIATGLGQQLVSNISRFLGCPLDVADKEVAALVEALRSTSVVKRNGQHLERVAPNDNPLYGVLAMHTLLLDAYQERHAQNSAPQLPTTELQAASRILERQFHSDIFQELYSMAIERRLPSYYVARLYGWEVDCDILQELRRQRETGMPTPQVETSILRLEAFLEKGAEKEVERLREAPLPECYLQKLDAELQTLGWLARFPERVEEPHISERLLLKYDIDPAWPQMVRMLQIEDAFRALDARLVLLTGRRPFANELFGTLRQQPSTPSVTSCRTAASRESPDEISSRSRKIKTLKS